VPGNLPQRCREEILRIALAHGARNVRVFGSMGHGSGVPRDLDLLVDMDEGRNLFDLIALTSELEEKLGTEVDVHTEAGISPYIRKSVLAESTPL
jgi:uncharacterized protein